MDFVQALLLALVVLCLCGFLGSGALILIYKGQRPGGADALLTGELILTGLAVTAHVAAVFTGQSFSRCTIFFVSLLGAALLFAAVLILFYGVSRKQKRKEGKGSAASEPKKPDSVEKFLLLLFGVLVLIQLFCLLRNAGVYIKSDMTVETVGSFLRTDGLYQVDPMTGQAYTEGIPARLKILCLPALYGFLCRLSGLTPETVVTVAVPVWTFIASYAAFSCVGTGLFPESRKKRICFLITIVIIMWAGCSLYSLDGFDLLYCGYRGVTIRNLVLLPYLISLCLRKRWRMVILCVLAEACIVWTFYGLGACLLTAAGLFLTERRRRNDGTS
ncbi:MAG: DUF6077 domain-containing protein [Blautia sp.]|nr:DUF6077 domain-containing protein [Blautia sp.]